jgi:Flp pilus assembly protein TadB
MPIVVYRARPPAGAGQPAGRPSLRDRLALALAAAVAVAILVAVLVVSFVIAIPLIAVALLVLARLAWRVRRAMRTAGLPPDGGGARWQEGVRWPGEPWR